MSQPKSGIANWTASRWISGIIVSAIIAGFAASAFGKADVASTFWIVAAIAALVPLIISILRALRERTAGVDIIALLAIIGALLMHEYLAGAVIALMLAGGNALEEFASGRARRELQSLVSRAPRFANLCVIEGESEALRSVPVDEVVPGDLLMVKPGDVVPVDGLVSGATTFIDESTLTGEAIPVERRDAEPVSSGTVNASGAPFRMRATAVASDSTHAGIVRLVAQAQAAKSPLTRLADRYGMFFLPFTIAVSAAAWLISGEPAAPSQSSSSPRLARSFWPRRSPLSREFRARPAEALLSRVVLRSKPLLAAGSSFWINRHSDRRFSCRHGHRNIW